MEASGFCGVEVVPARPVVLSRLFRDCAGEHQLKVQDVVLAVSSRLHLSYQVQVLLVGRKIERVTLTVVDEI